MSVVDVGLKRDILLGMNIAECFTAITYRISSVSVILLEQTVTLLTCVTRFILETEYTRCLGIPTQHSYGQTCF